MSRRLLAVIAAMLLAVGACQSGIESAGVADTVAIQTVYRDSRCLSDEAEIELLRDAAALADWWRPLASRQFPAKPLPQNLGAIDFDTSTVFVLFMGPLPTAGYDIDLYADRASVQGTSLTIPASWRNPAPDALLAQVVTNPCMVITVPAARYESVTIRDRRGNTLVEANF